MLNRTFSLEKGREISSLEARVESISRRVRISFGKKRHSLEQKPLSTAALVSIQFKFHRNLKLRDVED